jgi:hypothetical protein
LPDKWRNSEPIHSFHFRGKCFEMTPKEFQEGGIRIFVKVKEIELGV